MTLYPLLGVLLVLAISLLVAELIAEKVGINRPLSYLVIGFLVSEILTRNEIDIFLRADNFSAIVFQGLLPLILFEMTLSLVRPDKKELVKCSGLAIYLLIVFVIVATGIVYFLMAQPIYFPPIAALLSIAIIAAIEPVCSRLNSSDVKLNNKIRNQIETETVISDALAAVLFSLALMIAQGQLASEQLGMQLGLALITLTLGGLIAGAICGYCTIVIEHWCRSKVSCFLLSLTLAYSSYFLAEVIFSASGVVAVLTAGIIFRIKLNKAKVFRPIKASWNNVGYYADAWLFLLLGMTFTVDMFSERWIAMLIIVLSLVIGRMVAGISGYYIFKPYKQSVHPRPMLNGIIFGNYTGALAIALVFSLPEELSYWWTIQSMVFGAVLYSLLFQLPLFNFFNRRFK